MITTVAIPTDEAKGLDSRVCRHFGHAPHFVVVDIEQGRLKNPRTVDNPYLQNHQPGQVPAFVHSQGATVILAGGMGHRAMSAFQELGIAVALAEASTAGSSARAFIAGLRSEVEACSEHAHADDCGNH